jgi:hypothetical protein
LRLCLFPCAGCLYNFFGALAWNTHNTVGVAYNQVTRHYSDLIKESWSIDPTSGVEILTSTPDAQAACEYRESDRFKQNAVTDAAIDNEAGQPAVPRRRGHDLAPVAVIVSSAYADD